MRLRADKEDARVQAWTATHGALVAARAHELVRAGTALADLCVLIYPRAGRLIVEATLRVVLALELRELNQLGWVALLESPVHADCVRVFATRDGTEKVMFDMPLVAHAAPIDEAVR
jgi:hypothetical protein